MLKKALYANLHFVTPRLAIGGDLNHRTDLAIEQAMEIVDLGITHIVDCRQEWNDANVFASTHPELPYLHHGMDDAGQRVPAAWFDAAMQFVDTAHPEATVLTHCHMGINRGPSLGFAVLLHRGWDPIDAIAAIRAARPIAHAWYAEDALRWHHGRTHTDPTTDLLRLRRWRTENPLDVVRIIREQRAAGL